MTKKGLSGAAVLAAVKAKRGYLLPYHRMLAATDPELLAAYDAYYERLTLRPRALAPRQRELVWTALQLAAREAHGSIHLRRADQARIAHGRLADAAALAAAAESLAALDFAAAHWGRWIPSKPAVRRYLRLTEAARGGIDRPMAEIILVVSHAARRCDHGMRLHLARAFKAGVSVPQIAEGLSYMLLPCGGPALIDAVQCWADAAAAGLCPPPYRLPA
jgi:alkylhydroperoxidase/carboxymuconolactone decarboxylase family protein YurZ